MSNVLIGRQIKLCLMKEIERRKSILFGAFNETIKKEDKARLWKEVFEIGQSFGLFVGKEWAYIRDVYWPNVKKGTLTKIDNAKRNGATPKFNEIDYYVIQILGKECPAVEGFNVSETFQDVLEDSSTLEFDPQETGTTVPDISSEIMNDVLRKRKLEIPESEAVENKKLELEIDYLELTNRKLCLEVIKMERELELPRCETAKKYYPDN